MSIRRALAIPAAIAIALLAGCGTRAATVNIDGSSTVFPLTAVAAEEFQAVHPGIQVKVGSSGTSAGFARLCRGETDANDASRPITAQELAMCTARGVTVGRLTVALDAITVVVSRANTWATCLTPDQLRRIWEPNSTIRFWDQVDPAFPHEALALFGPGTASGTFDMFTEIVVGRTGASRTDFTPSEDDNVVVQGVSGTTGGLGYLGYTYYEQNRGVLRALAIDDGLGCVTPSPQSARDGTYSPFTRPLFLYPSVNALSEPHVRAFFDYLVANDATIARDAQVIPLNARQRTELAADFAEIVARIPPGAS